MACGTSISIHVISFISSYEPFVLKLVDDLFAQSFLVNIWGNINSMARMNNQGANDSYPCPVKSQTRLSIPLLVLYHIDRR